MKFNARITLVGLIILTLLGAGYMWLSVFDMGPSKQVTRLTLMLHTSGGLLPTSEVTMRGVKVGRVTDIQTTATGLAVSIQLDRAHPVPANSVIGVESLSAAGEQYIDFKPKLIAPPYFADGAVIPEDRVALTVTASELLTKANALASALNPANVRTIVDNVGQAFAGNDETLDTLAASTGLAANVVKDDKQLLATLFSNVSIFTTNLGELNAGPVISQTAKLLNRALPALIGLIDELEVLSHTAVGEVGPDDPIGTLLRKATEYIDTLSGPLSTFAAALQPVAAPLRGVKIDAGHWLDFWESTFNDTGGVRVQLNVPDRHQ